MTGQKDLLTIGTALPPFPKWVVERQHRVPEREKPITQSHDARMILIGPCSVGEKYRGTGGDGWPLPATGDLSTIPPNNHPSCHGEIVLDTAVMCVHAIVT